MGQNPSIRKSQIRNAVGSALRAAREAKGLSQAQLATSLQLFGWDIGRTTWTKIELGERTLSDCELIAVAEVLGISLDALAAAANRVTVRRVLRTLHR